jgi:predicted TIM-barrel fold metal-dependent hydrolase
MTKLSRRELLCRAGAAGVTLVAGDRSRLLAAAAQPATPIAFAVPAGACDCHTHVFGDPRRFAFAASRTYTPEPASVEEMRALHRALHTDRVVIVQPSVYGTDNACTLDAIRQLGPGARGVAVIDERTRPAALVEMQRQGIRGIRLNLATAGQTDPGIARERFDTAVAQVKALGWHVQIYTQLSIVAALKDRVAASPVPVVFDHFGGAQAAVGLGQPGFDTLLELVRSGHAYVKISAPYRSSSRRPDYADVAPLATALINANLQRILWGSDWPHPDTSQVPGRRRTDIAPLLAIDDGATMNQLPVWAPDVAARTAILVDNPARLYGFPSAAS